MKTKILVPLIAGACIGSLVTFFTMRASVGGLHGPIAARTPPPTIDGRKGYSKADPFTSGTEGTPPVTSGGLPHTKMDMSAPSQRDAFISLWYLDMQTVVENLEIHTGHKFKPVAKLSASPVEILEEQAAFMKEFLAETDRLYPKASSHK